MLDILKRFEKIMIQALMVMMAVVVGFATIDLAWILIKDIVEPPILILSVEQLLELFGLFMLVVIGIASIVLALTGGYFLMKTCQVRSCQAPDMED